MPLASVDVRRMSSVSMWISWTEAAAIASPDASTMRPSMVARSLCAAEGSKKNNRYARRKNEERSARRRLFVRVSGLAMRMGTDDRSGCEEAMAAS
jgi:hypothetical protein